jgi:hypothetical protein
MFHMPSPDFVGPLRDRVESMRGGYCLFLEGSGGNVMPRFALHETEGPEVAVGSRLRLEAVHAIADTEPIEVSVERVQQVSWAPTVVYRRRVAATQERQVVGRRSAKIDLPLQPAPPLDQLRAELDERRSELTKRRSAGEPGSVTNSIANHVQWLRATIEAAENGSLPDRLEAEIWAARIGESALVGAPAEVFTEIGWAVRRASPARVTLLSLHVRGAPEIAPAAPARGHGSRARSCAASRQAEASRYECRPSGR